MATPQEKLVESLEALKRLQADQNSIAIKTSDLSRLNRERLLQHGFIKKVLDGWYIVTPPNERQGDSTSWYVSYWSFCSSYLSERYGSDYCLSADQSLQIHAGNQTVPQQLIVRTTAVSNNVTSLLHGTSLFSMQSSLPEEAQIVVVNGMRMLSLPSSLIHCSPAMFKGNSTDIRTALTLVQDASDILSLLLDGGHSTIAGRLAGGFRNVGQDRIADDIMKTMQAAGYVVRESDPFEEKPSFGLALQAKSPHVNRIRLMWHEMREVVIEHFPAALGLPDDSEAYIQQVEEMYLTDAYHSLSIERYQVSIELIEKVRSGDWDPKGKEIDHEQRNALAARGYWLATQRVRESLKRVLNHSNAGQVADEDHGDWFRELFAPSVISGILRASDLAGYRSDQVYIGGSMHVPLSREAVREVMPEFFRLLSTEESAAVRAVLGHFVFVYIHPYMDGNGRMARFLMNVMLASGGYSWTVIPVEERDNYMSALESASVHHNIEPFTKLIAWLVEEGKKGTPVATIRNR